MITQHWIYLPKYRFSVLPVAKVSKTCIVLVLGRLAFRTENPTSTNDEVLDINKQTLVI